MNIQASNKVSGLVLILLSVLVSVPLTILTIRSGGGTWGFGMIGLPVLLPLCAYALFGIAPLIRDERDQWRIFIGTQVITLAIGIVSLLLFKLYPRLIIAIPITLAIISFASRKHFRQMLLIMILLGCVANIMLLKWEIDFGRTVPLVQLLLPQPEMNP